MEGIYRREPFVFLPGPAAGEKVRSEETAPWQEQVAYGALLLFVALIYLSPGTLHPALEDLPIAKGIAIFSFLFLFLAKRARGEGWRVTDKTSLALIAFALVEAVSIADALWREYALFVFLNAVKMVGVYFLITQLVTTPRRVRQLLWTLLLTAIVPAAGTLSHYFLKIDLVEGYRAAWVGVFADPNDMAYHLVVLIPLLSALLQTKSSLPLQAVLLAEAPLFLAAIYVTFSRGGLVGLLAVLFFQILRSHRRLLHFAIGALMMIFMLALAPSSYWERAETILKFRQDESAMGRIYAWRAGIAMLADRPLLGVGVGCFVLGWPIYAPAGAGTKWRAPHNTFVEVMGETGLLGSLAFFVFIWTALRGLQKLKSEKKEASPLFRADRLTAGPPATIAEDKPEDFYARGVEIALWGFLACSLTLGVVRSWPPYILAALAVSLRKMGAGRERQGPGGKSEDQALANPQKAGFLGTPGKIRARGVGASEDLPLFLPQGPPHIIKGKR